MGGSVTAFLTFPYENFKNIQVEREQFPCTVTSSWAIFLSVILEQA